MKSEANVRQVKFNPEELTDEARTEWLKLDAALKQLRECGLEPDRVSPNRDRRNVDRVNWRPFGRFLADHLFFGKCAYCESRVGQVATVELDHYRPKRNALGSEREYFPQHYAWLAFEWTNMLPACPKCNAAKGSRFPIAGPRAALGATDGELAAEEPLLLHPMFDNPIEHIWFDDEGYCLPRTGSVRGEVTIHILGLNRAGLVTSRRNAIQAARFQLQAAPNEEMLESVARELIAPQQEYSAARRFAVARVLSSQVAAD